MNAPWPVPARDNLPGWQSRRIQAFIEKVHIPDPVKYPDACWIWQAGYSKRGYGVFAWADPVRQKRPAHGCVNASRAAYILFVDDLLPDHYACHRCDDPACVRPSHLFSDTAAGNMADMRAKGRAWYQRRAA